MGLESAQATDKAGQLSVAAAHTSALPPLGIMEPCPWYLVVDADRQVGWAQGTQRRLTGHRHLQGVRGVDVCDAHLAQ
jgi:hypothetical protein